LNNLTVTQCGELTEPDSNWVPHYNLLLIVRLPKLWSRKFWSDWPRM